MPIKFFNLLQDSWNFMRNQWQFSLIAVILVLCSHILNSFLLPERQSIQPEIADQYFAELSSSLVVLLGLALIGIFLNVLFILNIHSISQGKYQHFAAVLPTALAKSLPIAILMVLCSLPFSLGVAAGIFLQQHVISFVLMVSGFYMFIKFALTNLVYLTETPQKSIFETLKHTWAMSRGKMLTLILYCVLFYMLQGTLNAILLNLNQNLLVSGLGMIASSVLNIFMTIFSYRFYQAYKQAV